MAKFDQVLSDEEIDQIVNGLIWISGDSFCFGKDVATHIIQAVLAKLAEREPVAIVDYFDGVVGLKKLIDTLPKGTKLYAHPMPNSQGLLDSSNHIADKRKMVECAKCGNPAIHHLIMDNLGYPNKTPICGGCTQEHEHLAQDTNDHEIRNFGGAYGLVTYHYEPLGTAQPDHIPDAGKMVVPHGYRLVSVADIDTAIQRASVFDDGGDGADPESARSCIEILKSMISSKAVDSLEPKKEVVHDRHTGRELLYIPPVGESLYSMAQARKESFSLALSVDTKKAQALLQSYLDSLEGWQLVPKQVNGDMLKAMERTHQSPVYMYHAALAAAPKYTEGK